MKSASNQILARYLFERIQKNPKHMKQFVDQFLLFLWKTGFWHSLSDIQSHLERMIDEKSNTLPVELTTAFPISEAEAQKIANAVKQLFGRPTREWEHFRITRHINPGIIGGAVIKAYGMKIDLSIGENLNQLSKSV